GLVDVPDAVLRGMNLGYKRMGLRASLSVLGGLLTAAAIYAGYGLVGVGGVQIVITLVAGVLFWFLVRRYVPWFGVVRPTLAEVRSFLGLSSWYTAGNVIALLLLSSDVIILGMLASAATV